MRRDTVGTVLAVAVLGLGGVWVYQLWKKSGGTLGTIGGVFNSEVSQSYNPSVGSLTAANTAVAAAESKGDPTLNRTMADILGSPVPLPGYSGLPALNAVQDNGSYSWFGG